MAKPVFTLRLTWNSLEHSPEWELETEHQQFANWVAPALFAGGYTSPHPRLLELQDGRMLLRLNDGVVLELSGDGTVRLHGGVASNAHRAADPGTAPGLATIRASAWRLATSASGVGIARCEDYEKPSIVAPSEFSQMGLDGEWWPSAYEVRGPNGHVPVTVAVDETGEHVTARLEDEISSPDGCLTAAIAIVPKT